MGNTGPRRSQRLPFVKPQHLVGYKDGEGFEKEWRRLSRGWLLGRGQGAISPVNALCSSKRVKMWLLTRYSDISMFIDIEKCENVCGGAKDNEKSIN